MTRFARAKGSKASNEKAPEDGTPWEVMKEQLLNAKKESEEMKNRQEAEKQRMENYEKFLMEQKIQKRKATWCDFPEAEQVKKQKDFASSGENISKPKKRKKNKQNELALVEPDELTNNVNDFKNNQLQIKSASKETNNLNTFKINNNEQPIKKKKKSKSKKNDSIDNKDEIQEGTPNTDVDQSTPQFNQKKHKNKKKFKNLDSTSGNHKDESNSNIEVNQTNQSISHKTKKSYKKEEKTVLDTKDSTESNVTNNENSNNKTTSKLPKKKKNKLINGKPVRRKEINDRSYQLIINGKEVELMRYEGFPIMKKDAERLAELKGNMIKKGIPKSEVQRTIKLERRRAEKALARLRRDVCYNCRKGGHNLSDCPDLKSKIPGVDAPDGVCFKCGSTEHRQSECKVQRDKEFRFATCFICKEAGHIARQCPDNPKGLYPNGGCCKLCGDVTHLRKDCPTVNQKKEKTSVKLPTLDSTDNIEDIGVKENTSNFDDTVKKPKKIKF